MAENKKSFIAYSDWNGMFQKLPDEIAGKLIKHIFLYVNDENPTSDDYVINALFEQIKSTLKRDLIKWEEQREQRSRAGKKSAEQRATKLNERSTERNEDERNSTVNVSVSDNVNVNDINKGKNFVFYSELSNSESWIERVAMTNTQKYKPNEVKAKLKTFFDDCDVRGDVKTNKTDFQSHFVRWLNQQVKPKETTKRPPLL